MTAYQHFVAYAFLVAAVAALPFAIAAWLRQARAAPDDEEGEDGF